jgi:hypothetical protein
VIRQSVYTIGTKFTACNLAGKNRIRYPVQREHALNFFPLFISPIRVVVSARIREVNKDQVIISSAVAKLRDFPATPWYKFQTEIIVRSNVGLNGKIRIPAS